VLRTGEYLQAWDFDSTKLTKARVMLHFKLRYTIHDKPAVSFDEGVNTQWRKGKWSGNLQMSCWTVASVCIETAKFVPRFILAYTITAFGFLLLGFMSLIFNSFELYICTGVSSFQNQWKSKNFAASTLKRMYQYLCFYK
jgi:hypothetical protein